MENHSPESTSVNALFSQLNEKADLVYRFASLYNDYMSEKHDYGTGHLINMVEVHTLTAIEENPGITISQLALMWHRTNSALSQTATKLEKRDTSSASEIRITPVMYGYTPPPQALRSA